MSITLLRRGAMRVPEGTPAPRRAVMEQSIPRDYIVKTVMDTAITGPGSLVWVVRAGTGSGKSTVLPPAFADALGRKVAVTEPRRLTAEEIPYDIAKFDPTRVMGETIGFQTSLINKVPRKGPVYMTTGVLLMQMMRSPAEKIIRRYSAIFIDEVHTHDLAIDMLLRVLKQFLSRHWNTPECPRVFLMSGTMDPARYTSYFETSNVFDVEGASFPIETHFMDAAPGNIIEALVARCQELEGDTLVFLPTAKTIKAARLALESALPKTTVVEIMSASVARGEVKQLMRPGAKGAARIALATNAAETGLTLDYLINVIDSGLSLNVGYNPVYETETVALQPCSQASALQRKGRVGRKQPGNWYPLYTEETFRALTAASPAEIYSTDAAGHLLGVIVTLTESRIDYDKAAVERRTDFDPATLGLVNPPTSDAMVSVYDRLYGLGFVDAAWNPTLAGCVASGVRRLSPESARMILSAGYYGADPHKLIIIAAIIEAGGFGDAEGLETHDRIVRCDFIRALLTYEHFQRRVAAMPRAKRTPMWPRRWCDDAGLSYAGMLAAVELAYDMTLQFMGLGYRVDTQGPPLLDTLDARPDAARSQIRAIKNCIYEGYRFRAASWNDKLQSYVTLYRHNRIATAHALPEPRPRTIVSNAVVYGNFHTGMSYQTGAWICTLDGDVDLDPHFLF